MLPSEDQIFPSEDQMRIEAADKMPPGCLSSFAIMMIPVVMIINDDHHYHDHDHDDHDHHHHHNNGDHTGAILEKSNC